MTTRHFLIFLGLAAFLIGAYLAFTWIVDPYGASPIHVSWDRVNVQKPKRRSIDRVIKPYEVWRYQPRTVFMGSSRILQAIDPSVMDGSKFAPAYNAAMSGNTINLDAAHLEQFVRLNPNLKYVFVELFLWNHLMGQTDVPEIGFSAFFKNAVALHFSADTLWDSIITVKHNQALEPTGTYANWRHNAYVDWRGKWVTLRGWDSKLHFDYYITGIMGAQKSVTEFKLQPKAFKAMDRIVEICRQNGLELHFIIMPNHPFDDYRLSSFGLWDTVEQWQRSVAEYRNVHTASQYTAPLVEPISKNMSYWNDPMHQSSKYGELIVRAFLGERSADIPADILLPMTDSSVEDILRKRRTGLERWIADNRNFAEEFEKAKIASGFATSNDR